MTPRHPAAIAVVERVAELYGIDAEVLWGNGRLTATMTEARHLAWWKIRERTGWSYPEIARALQLQDHTSTLYGIKKVSRKAAERLVEKHASSHLTGSDYGADLEHAANLTILAHSTMVSPAELGT